MLRKMNGRSALLEILIDEGVSHLFGNPGTTELAVMDAIPSYPQLKYVLALQEAAVVAMADGYCRASHRLAACNLHCTPGLGHAMGAMYNAAFSGSPIIITAGDYAVGYGLQEPLLWGPMVEMARPLVKWAAQITNVRDLPGIVRRAAKLALTPPSGPVFLALPADVLDQEAELDLGKPTRVVTANRPADATIRTLASRLVQAKRPVLIAGQEVASNNATEQVAALAECLGAAVFQESVFYNARFPSQHPACFGDLTRNQSRVRETLQGFDLLVCLGADLLRMSAYSPVVPLPPDLPVIHITDRHWELGKTYSAEFAICADVKETASALLQQLEDAQTDTFRREAAERRKGLTAHNWTAQRKAAASAAAARSKAVPIDPGFLVMSIADCLPEDAIVIEEAPTSAAAIATFVPTRDASSFYGLASGGLGFGLSGAVGMSLAAPSRPIVALIGDGSVMYSLQGLWTARHFQLPITYIVINNRSYRILKERMVAFRDSHSFIGMDLEDPEIDFQALAKGFGMSSVRIEEPAAIVPAVSAAIKSRQPSLIEVVVQGM